MKKSEVFVSGLGTALRSALAAAGLAGTLLLAACGGATGDTSQGNTPDPTTPSAPVAAEINLELAATSVQNGGSDTVLATVTAVNSNRNLIANVPVTFSVDSDGTALASGKATDATGKVTAAIGIGPNRANRIITVTARSGNLTRTASLQVIGARLAATALPASLAPGESGTVLFRLTDVSSKAMVSQDIIINGVGAVETRAKTNLSGEYTYSYNAPNAATTLNIRAAAGGVELTQAVIVTPVGQVVPPVVADVKAASLSLSADRVPVNFGSSNNRVEVRALFLHEGNRPAAGVRVRFSLPDPLAVGGTLSTGSTMVYADAFGIAATTYVPGQRSSPTDGVIVQACWSKEDFAANTPCPPGQTLRAVLTVAAEALSVSIGTDKFIVAGPTGIDYVKRFLVQVNDSAGNPMADVDLATVLDLTGYYTGFWQTYYDPVTDSRNWEQIRTTPGMCSNEDLNRNGAVEFVNVLEAPGFVNEDASRNGQLDPRKADVVLAFEGSSRTDAKGQAVVRITYPQNVGSWARYRIDVVARGISGSEGRAWFEDDLAVLAEDVSDGETTPAFYKSPYGVDGLNIATYTYSAPQANKPANLQLCVKP